MMVCQRRREIPFEYVETDYNANTYTYSFEYYTHQ